MANRQVLLGVALLLSTGVAAAAEAEWENELSATVGVGIQYDSNVAVLDLDAASGAGDLAALLELGLAWQWRSGDGPGIRAGYDLSQSRHFDLGEFDLRTQHVALEGSTKLGETDVGLLLNGADAALDGDRFLTFSQASPYLSRMFAERLVLRLAWAWTDKDFSREAERDARTRTLSGDAFILLDGIRHYLMVSYRHDDARARDTAHQYTGQRMSAQWIRRVPAGSREATLRAGLRYEGRQYADSGLVLAASRRDQRYRLETRVELPVSGRVTGVARYEYGDHRSNLAAVDFSEHFLSLSLRADF